MSLKAQENTRDATLSQKENRYQRLETLSTAVDSDEEQRRSSPAAEDEVCKDWVLYALASGMTYAVGNIFFGIGCSKYGLVGAGIPAPTAVLTILIYRLVEACKNKRQIGSYVDRANSNFWQE